jgi:hypothetical protein
MLSTLSRLPKAIQEISHAAHEKLAEPVITNRSIDLLAVVGYLCFAWWGFWSTISGIPTINQAADQLYVVVWGGSIALLSMVAALAAFSTFFTIKNITRVTKKIVERIALLPLIGLIFVYPSTLIGQAIMGDSTKTATIGLALFFVAVTLWRAIHLKCRIKGLRTLQKSDANG